MTVQVNFVKRLEGASLPEYGSAEAAGADVRSAIDICVPSGEARLVDTGIDCVIPSGYEIQVRPRSGLALKKGITVLNSPGTIDSDYSGPLGVILYNTSNKDFQVNAGDRIAQLVVAPVIKVNYSFTNTKRDTERSSAGFGSTGV